MTDPLKHVNINIPESKHQAFKVKATTEGLTMQEVVDHAIDHFLEEQPKKPQPIHTTSVRIPEDLHFMVLDRAFLESTPQNKKTFSDVVREALTDYLDQTH